MPDKFAESGIAAGSTSVSVYLTVRNSGTGALLTGLVFNTSGLVASYARAGAARVAITMVTQTAAGAFSSGGFVAVDGTNMPGVYRLDVPDAAIDHGAESVTFALTGASSDCVVTFALVAPTRATAQAVTGTLTVDSFTANFATTPGNDRFQNRVGRFTSGTNVGRPFVVTTNTGNTFKIAPPLPAAPANLDWFVLDN